MQFFFPSERLGSLLRRRNSEQEQRWSKANDYHNSWPCSKDESADQKISQEEGTKITFLAMISAWMSAIKITNQDKMKDGDDEGDEEGRNYFAGVYVRENCPPTAIAVAQLHNWGAKQNKLRSLRSHHLHPPWKNELSSCSLPQEAADRKYSVQWHPTMSHWEWETMRERPRGVGELVGFRVLGNATALKFIGETFPPS